MLNLMTLPRPFLPFNGLNGMYRFGYKADPLRGDYYDALRSIQRSYISGGDGKEFAVNQGTETEAQRKDKWRQKDGSLLSATLGWIAVPVAGIENVTVDQIANAMLRGGRYVNLYHNNIEPVCCETSDEIDDGDPIADQHEKAIKGRTDIGATTKEQLVKSRRGQGVFRSNVRLNEKGCRVTGVTDPQHLRASHIKPWKDSTDEEKLDGCNGLLLAPHIDHLFDKGQITFTNNGDLLVSPRMDRAVLAKWGVLAGC